MGHLVKESSRLDEHRQTDGATAEFIGQVTRCQRRLYAFIYSLIRSAADADDVLQETNLILWRKSAEFTAGTDFMAWACRIAHFQVMAHRKNKQRAREHFDERLIAMLADEAHARGTQSEDRHHAMIRCMKKLPEAHRTLIAARYEPGASVKEMASKSGRTPKAVSEALRRIREALMKCINKRLAMEGGA